MSRLIYQVAVGPLPRLWERCIATVAAYAARIGAEHHVQRDPILRIVPGPPRVGSRAPALGYLAELEKFAAWPRLVIHEQIAQIDADVYVHEDAPSVFEATDPLADFAAVVEPHIPASPAYRAKLRWYARGQYGDADAEWFQCGVQVLRPGILARLNGQAIGDLLRSPRWAPLVNGEGAYRWSTEQTLLNLWLRENDVATDELPWRWNAPFGMMADPAGAYFTHFVCSSRLTGDDPVEMISTGRGRSRI